MDVDLIGYLLGSLDAHEMRVIEERLAQDSELRRELAELEQKLDQVLPEPRAAEFPPAGLLNSTLDFIDQHESEIANIEPAGQPVVSPSMTPEIRPSATPGWRWLDVGMLALATAGVLAILLPSLLQWRSMARRVACQDQLRQLGVAIFQYASADTRGEVPAVSSSGPEAFAGVYAVRLAGAGVLDSNLQRWCPSLDVNVESVNTPFTLVNRVPTLDQLRGASADELKRYHRRVGGHYAYNLGVMQNEERLTPRLEGRSSFAVLADHPDVSSYAAPHDGSGINVLFEDGHVGFIASEALDVVPDNPLQNHLGHVEAGVHLDDAALGASWRAPFRSAQQR
ncbi:MAG: hypothetical protein AAF664_21685 [Planctomycetota bacterium]